MTAGATSQNPRRRSCLAPSDSSGRAFRGFACAGVVVVAGAGTVVLISSSFGSRDQALGRESIVDLADHGLLGALRAERRRGRDLVREVDGDHLVERGLRPDAAVLERGQ